MHTHEEERANGGLPIGSPGVCQFLRQPMAHTWINNDYGESQIALGLSFQLAGEGWLSRWGFVVGNPITAAWTKMSQIAGRAVQIPADLYLCFCRTLCQIAAASPQLLPGRDRDILGKSLDTMVAEDESQQNKYH